MNLYAVLSDIHANYEALLKVEKDAREQARKEKAELRFVCLGDVVDYGPQPDECMAWVREHVDPNLFVCGNHDQDVVTDGPPQTIHSDYWPIHLWTRWKLADEHKAFLVEHKEWKRPSPDGLADFTLFHGSLSGVGDYIKIEGTAETNMGQLQTPYALFGHSHYQGCFCYEGEFKRGKWQTYFLQLTAPEDYRKQTGPLRDSVFAKAAENNLWKPLPLNEWRPLPLMTQALLNPGSVGQPRRHDSHKDPLSGVVPHDPRAAYLLLALNGDGPGQYQFRRVPYPVEKTVERLRRLRYPEEPEFKYAVIDQGRPSRNRDDPWEKLKYTQEHIHELLPELIEKTLIPTLLQGW